MGPGLHVRSKGVVLHSDPPPPTGVRLTRVFARRGSTVDLRQVSLENWPTPVKYRITLGKNVIMKWYSYIHWPFGIFHCQLMQDGLLVLRNWWMNSRAINRKKNVLPYWFIQQVPSCATPWAWILLIDSTFHLSECIYPVSTPDRHKSHYIDH